MKRSGFQRIYNNILSAKLEELKIYRPIGIGECCKLPNAIGCYEDEEGWWNVYETDDWQQVIVRARTTEEDAFDMLYAEIIGAIQAEYRGSKREKTKEYFKEKR